MMLYRRPGFFLMLGDGSPDIHGTNSITWYPSRERYTVSKVDSQVFTPCNFGSTVGII